MSSQLHCHHCTHWMGESSAPLTFAGMFRDLRDRTLVPAPRSTYRCKHCGWINVFRQDTSWRSVELKHAG